MFRQLIRRLGKWWSSILLTGLGVLISFLITVSASLLLNEGRNLAFAVPVSLVVPAVVSFPVSYITCSLLVRLDKAERERAQLVAELQEALDNVQTLSGLLPICASCRRIRDDEGQWQPVEVYISDRSEADFSHGICPECAQELYPDMLQAPEEAHS